MKLTVSPFKNWIYFKVGKYSLSYAWDDHGKPYFVHLKHLRKIRLCFGKRGEIIFCY